MSTKRVFSALSISALIGFQGCATDDGADNLSTIEADITLPAPLNLVVTVTSAVGESLAWETPAGVTPDKYIIYRGLAPGAETTFTSASAAPTTFAYNHLTPSTNYCWQVRYLVGSSLSPPSNEQCATTNAVTPPTAPANVVATAISSSRITVTWDAVPGASSYQVLQGTAPAAPVFVGTVTAPTTTFQAAGLASNTTFAFQIRAVTPDGTSVASTPAATATTFLAGLEAYYKFDERTGSVALDSSGAGRTGTLSGGAVLSGDRPQVLDDKSALLVSAATAANVTVPNVGAFNLTGAYSVAAWVKIPVAANVAIVGSRVAGCGPLGWELGQDATGLFLAGRTGVFRAGTSLAPGGWNHVAVTSDGATVTFYVNGVAVVSGAFALSNTQHSPLTVGHVGDCASGAVDVDELQLLSRVLSADEIAKIGKLPDAPTNLVVDSVTSLGEQISWTAVPGATKYIIFVGTAAGAEVFLTSAGTAPTFLYQHLQPNTQYFWKVSTVADQLFSVTSNEASATTSPPPAQPVGVTATALATTRVQIDWGTVSGATSYRVLQSVSGGPFTFLSTVLAPTTTFRANNLTSGTTYAYEIQAVDNVGTVSTVSAPATVTTP